MSRCVSPPPTAELPQQTDEPPLDEAAIQRELGGNPPIRPSSRARARSRQHSIDAGQPRSQTPTGMETAPKSYGKHGRDRDASGTSAQQLLLIRSAPSRTRALPLRHTGSGPLASAAGHAHSTHQRSESAELPQREQVRRQSAAPELALPVSEPPRLAHSVHHEDKEAELTRKRLLMHSSRFHQDWVAKRVQQRISKRKAGQLLDARLLESEATPWHMIINPVVDHPRLAQEEDTKKQRKQLRRTWDDAESLTAARAPFFSRKSTSAARLPTAASSKATSAKSSRSGSPSVECMGSVSSLGPSHPGPRALSPIEPCVSPSVLDLPSPALGTPPIVESPLAPPAPAPSTNFEPPSSTSSMQSSPRVPARLPPLTHGSLMNVSPLVTPSGSPMLELPSRFPPDPSGSSQSTNALSPFAARLCASAIRPSHHKSNSSDQRDAPPIQRARSNSFSSMFASAISVPDEKQLGFIVASEIHSRINQGKKWCKTEIDEPCFVTLENAVNWRADLSSVLYFIEFARINGQIKPHSLVISLIYLDRFLSSTGFSKLTQANWRPVTLMALLQSVKTWEKFGIQAIDCYEMFPHIGTLPKLNEWESIFLTMLDFDLNIAVGVYAQRYFQLYEKLRQIPL